MSRWSIFAGGALILAVLGWYLFRPERLFIDAEVNEEFPVASAQQAVARDTGPVLLVSGSFKGVAHETAGTASIYGLPGGEQVLRLTEFETSNGPDVQVYLVAAKDARDDETVKQAGFISLGPLKGNIGDQNYTVPPGVDLAKYQAVTIWCRRFSVNFGTAPLSPRT